MVCYITKDHYTLYNRSRATAQSVLWWGRFFNSLALGLEDGIYTTFSDSRNAVNIANGQADPLEHQATLDRGRAS